MPQDNVLHIKETTFLWKLSWCCSWRPIGWSSWLLFELTNYFSISDPFGLVKYVAIIRQLYEDREGWLAPFPWCEEFRFNLDNIFTRLKFVSRRKERGIKTDDSVDMFQIFQPHKECSQPRRVLIEGQPGIGKTTYCHKIAYDWAKKRKRGDSFPDVILVLLLKCRDINSGLWESIDDQLLPREVNEEDKERFFTFIRDHQSKVLLVLDGLDELPSSQLSIYKDIIQGRDLPESYFVVTARHEVVNDGTRMLPHPVRGRRVYQDRCQRIHSEIFQRRRGFGSKALGQAGLWRNPTRPYSKSVKHGSSMPPLRRLSRKIPRK